MICIFSPSFLQLLHIIFGLGKWKSNHEQEESCPTAPCEGRSIHWPQIPLTLSLVPRAYWIIKFWSLGKKRFWSRLWPGYPGSGPGSDPFPPCSVRQDQKGCANLGAVCVDAGGPTPQTSWIWECALPYTGCEILRQLYNPLSLSVIHHSPHLSCHRLWEALGTTPDSCGHPSIEITPLSLSAMCCNVLHEACPLH